jgi:hypothetical protein
MPHDMRDEIQASSDRPAKQCYKRIGALAKREAPISIALDIPRQRRGGLRSGHTVYSLRHSFKDRLIAAEAQDSLIDSLIGHDTYKPKYGKGPSLELKLKYLQRIAFKPPPSLR